LRTLPLATVEYRDSQPRPRLRYKRADDEGVDITADEESGQNIIRYTNRYLTLIYSAVSSDLSNPA
jgi:hypothetical protein